MEHLGLANNDAYTPLRQFVATAPLPISRRTHLVAVTHPTVASGNPKDDGWFIADFYAMNYLYHGQGANQVWLTAAPPLELLQKYGDVLHGNPYHDRKVVLSHDLIRARKLTMPTVVQPDQMLDRFQAEIQKAVEAAERDGGDVLLCVFCHGEKGLGFLLNANELEEEYWGDPFKEPSKHIFTYDHLRSLLRPTTKVALLTTACYSGGWLAKLDVTGLAAASEKDLSLSWSQSPSIGRACGSVFVSAVVGALTRTTSPLLNDEEAQSGVSASSPPSPLQPRDPTEVQTATYNAFCRAVVESLTNIHRLADEHKFTFSAQNEGWEAPWTEKSGMEPADYKQKWSALPVYAYRGTQETKDNMDPSPSNPTFQASGLVRSGGLDSLAALGGSGSGAPNPSDTAMQRRVRATARLFSEAFPGDLFVPRGKPLGSMVRYCIQTGDANYRRASSNVRWNLFAVVEYRCEMAQLADHVVQVFGLPLPRGETCFRWKTIGRDPQADRLDYEKGNLVWRALFPYNDHAAYGEQGPPFLRFKRYLDRAIMLANKDVETTMRMVEAINRVVLEAARQSTRHTSRVLENPEVRQRGRDWLRSLGRRIRTSVSPKKHGDSRPPSSGHGGGNLLGSPSGSPSGGQGRSFGGHDGDYQGASSVYRASGMSSPHKRPLLPSYMTHIEASGGQGPSSASPNESAWEGHASDHETPGGRSQNKGKEREAGPEEDDKEPGFW